MNCFYCESSEIQERKITENNFAMAFPTNIPIVPGHTLIIPKRHVARFEEMTADEQWAVGDLRTKIMSALEKAFQAEGFNFAWNDGKIAGQSIPHFHLHIVPRKAGDAGVYEYEPRKFLYRPGEREKSPEAELNKVAKLIAENL